METAMETANHFELEKIQWRIYLDKNSTPDSEAFFAAFNTWIPESPEIFVDVADYQHVEDGLLVYLVGHYVDYALDHTGRRHSLLYSRKWPMEGSNLERLQSSMQEAFKACDRLEKSPHFEGMLKFDTTSISLCLNDRASAPNNEQTLSKMKADLDSVLDSIYGAGNYSYKRESDARQRFTLYIEANQAPQLKNLLEKTAV